MIDNTIGYLMIQVLKQHRATAESALNALGLHAGQEMVLFRLYHEDGLTGTQLANMLKVEPPTITKMVQRMADNGLVEKRADPDDGRVTRVYLTEHGRSLESGVRRVWHDLETRTLLNLSADEQNTLRDLLSRMLANFNAP